MALRLEYEALGYAARGWPVFPCDPETKRPLTEHGFQDASTERETIGRWWRQWPDAMIGVPTGAQIGAFVLDLDPKDGMSAEALLRKVTECLAALREATKAAQNIPENIPGIASRFAAEVERAAGHALPPAPMVRTPRGGLHVWFAMPADIAVGNRAGVIPGVDVRGTGGYVILPPSVRRGAKARAEGCDGIAYRWEEDAGVDEIAPPDAPAELIQFVTERHVNFSAHDRDGENYRAPTEATPPGAPGASAPSRRPPRRGEGFRAADELAVRRYALAALDREVQGVERAGKGGRNDALNRAAFALGQLVGAGALSESTVQAALENAAAANGLLKEDGLRSVRATIRSGLEDGISSPRDLSDIGRRTGAGLWPAFPDRLPDYASDYASAPQPHDWDGAPEAQIAGGSAAAGRGGSGGATPPPKGEGSPAGGGGGGDGDGLDPEKLAAAAAEPLNDTGNARRLMLWFGDDFLNVDIAEGQNAALGLHHWTGTHWKNEGGVRAVQRFAQVTAERIHGEADVLSALPWELEALRIAKAAREKPDEELTPEDKAAIDAAGKVSRAIGDRRKARRKFAISCGNTARLNGMIAQALPHVTVPPEKLDREALAINVENGTLRAVQSHDPECPDADCDGSCGRKAWRLKLDPHDRGDLISKVMPVAWDPDAACPVWDAFVERFQPRESVRKFLQRWHGLALTGIVEQAFVLNCGLGANGKSTFSEALARLMGPYAQTLPAEALTGEMQRRGDQATPEFARLPGARLVRCAELPRGQNFRENTLKMLTGGEKMPVRHLHGRFFDLNPVFKAIGSCNEKPDIGGVDEGIWRRVKLVPWEVQIPLAERKPMAEVLDGFDAERAGILNWLLEGLLDYLEHGLAVPEEVSAATESYRADMDPVGEFIAACLRTEPGTEETARNVYVAYRSWCHANSVRPYSEKSFSVILPQKGIAKKSGRIRKYLNVRLHDVPEDPERTESRRGDGWSGSWIDPRGLPP